jgi:catechol 2,3-dioxygenase-like lactoylglutathione lyase family enzyme
MNTDPKIVSHVEMSVSNLEAAVAFYEQVMGWSTIKEPFVVIEESDTQLGKMCIDAFGTGWDSFKIVHLSTGDGIGVELFEFLNDVAPQQFEYWKTDEFHFCVEEANIEDLVEKIVAHGGQRQLPLREYDEYEESSKTIYVEDPFGVVFEIVTHSYEMTYSQGAY